MRFVSIFALATFVGLGTVPCGAPAAPAPVRVVADDAMRASMVTVSARIGYHRDAIGAGVIVSAFPYGVRVMTARHVVLSGDVSVWIEHRPYRAEVVRTFPHRDVAVLDALVPDDVRVRIRVADAGRETGAGDALTVWGENDDGPQMQPARVVAPHWRDPNDSARPALLQIACERCEPGDSGGGVFSADGALVGILTARYRTREGSIVAVVAEPVDPSLYAAGER